MCGGLYVGWSAVTEGLPVGAALEQAPTVLVRRVLDGVLVLGERMSEPIRIGSPGDLLWEMFAQPCTPEAVVEAWSAEFEITLETAREHVVPVLEVWIAGGALRVAGVGDEAVSSQPD